MIIHHRMRDKHQIADNLSKKTEFFERLDQIRRKSRKDSLFLNRETFEAISLKILLDKSGHPIRAHSELRESGRK